MEEQPTLERVEPDQPDQPVQPGQPRADRRKRARLYAWVVVTGVVALVIGVVQLTGSPEGTRWWVAIVAYCVAALMLGIGRRSLVAVPAWAVIIASLYFLAGGAAIMVATRQHVLWQSLLALLVTVVVGAVASLVVIDVVRERDVTPTRADGIRMAVIASAGIGMTAWGVLAENRLLAFEGLTVGGVGLAGLTMWVGRVGVTAPGRFLLGSLAALAQSVVLLQSARGADLALGVGLVLAIAGLTVFKLAMHSWINSLDHPSGRVVANVQRARLASAAAGAGALVSVLPLAYGATQSNATALIGGMMLAITALSALGISLVFTPLPAFLPIAMAITGCVAVGAGLFFTRDAIRVWGIALLVVAMVAGAGAWFVLRGEGIVALLLIGFVVLWGLGDRATVMETDPNPNAPGRILAIGDSFISGEGASEYFSGTNSVGDEQNECRRAPTAYSYLVAVELEMGLDFFACSGATSLDVLSRGQMPRSPEQVVGGRAQLANLESFSPGQIDAIDVVLVSIGGNDVGFSTIVKACLLPRDCNERQDDWLANVSQLRPQLVTTYEAIKQAVPNTPVIAMPYPMVTGESECGIGLQTAEHKFVVSFIRALDAEIEAAAAEAGVRYFAEGVGAFEGHGLCDDEPATNHLDLAAPEGDSLGRYSPGKWVHGSMHPNELGHRLTAAALRPVVEAAVSETAEAQQEAEQTATEVVIDVAEAAVDELAEDSPALARPEVRAEAVDAITEGALDALSDVDFAEANPEPIEPETPTTIPEEEVEKANEAQELLTDNQWITQELFRTVRALLTPLLLVLIGAMFLAIGLVKSRRGIVAVLSPLEPAVGAYEHAGLDESRS